MHQQTGEAFNTIIPYNTYNYVIHAIIKLWKGFNTFLCNLISYNPYGS